MGQGEGENNIETPKTVPQSSSEVIMQYGPNVKGMKSACGIVVGEIHPHAAKRICERNVTFAELADLIKNSSITYPGNKPDRTCLQKDDLRLVLVNSTGEIRSVVRL